MRHLVISVSAESSLNLLSQYADILLLDRASLEVITRSYETVYIRSHFGTINLQPQAFRNEIKNLVSQAKQRNPDVRFIDGVDNVDEIISFEDKLFQYQTFSSFMPQTHLLGSGVNIMKFSRPIFKNRLSSRGNKVTWDMGRVSGPASDWIIQESIDITEELRIYVVHGKVCSVGVIRREMKEGQRVRAVSSKVLISDEVQFASKIAREIPKMDVIGLDVARDTTGKLFLMEVNRSPGFASYNEMTGINLATVIYGSEILGAE